MRKLIEGIVDFRKKLTEERRELFAKLALGQKPDALFVACCDSRVVPNLFASTNPGDLFVLRNMGNLIPPASSQPQEMSTPAAIEFSIFSLNISDIIVCGHSECGALEALSKDMDATCCPHLSSWLKYAEPYQGSFVPSPTLSKQNQLSQRNVLQQLEHLKTYPFVLDRIEKQQLRIHGWWFDIGRAEVYCYEPSLESYVLIDEKEARLILERLG